MFRQVLVRRRRGVTCRETIAEKALGHNPALRDQDLTQQKNGLMERPRNISRLFTPEGYEVGTGMRPKKMTAKKMS
jgi:hypothetical protein